MKIWIITADTGSYDDYSEWTVAIYNNQLSAQEHFNKFNTWLKDNHWTIEQAEISRNKNKYNNPYDTTSPPYSMREGVSVNIMDYDVISSVQEYLEKNNE